MGLSRAGSPSDWTERSDEAARSLVRVHISLPSYWLDRLERDGGESEGNEEGDLYPSPTKKVYKAL